MMRSPDDGVVLEQHAGAEFEIGRGVVARSTLAGVLPLVFLLATAVAGVDFGQYWDDEAMLTKVRRSLTSPPTLLPYAYDYPGATFLTALAAVAPEAARDPGLMHVIPDTTALEAFTRSTDYRLRLRTIFAVISCLTVVLIAGVSFVIDGRPWQAFVAAALFSTSWEVGYHIRWIAPDGMTMAFVTAAAGCATAALRTPGSRGSWLRAGAVCAGLATGTKYSAWPIVVPVFVAAWLGADDGVSIPRRLWEIARLGVAAIVTFLVVSPGTLLQPTLAISGMRAQIVHYSLGHGIYTVGRGADHLFKMLTYVMLVQPSPYLLAAVASTVAALVGTVSLAKESPRTAIVVLSFPALFLAYFAMQRAMIVRNLLLLAPFGAMLAARGAHVAWQTVSRSAVARTFVACAVGLVLVADGAYQVSAMKSIRSRDRQRTFDEFKTWLDRQPHDAVRMVGRLAHSAPLPVSLDTSDADVAMYAAEAVALGVRPNKRATFARVFGPREVNLNYYPDWPGDDHIVIVSRRRLIHEVTGSRDTDVSRQ